MKNETMQHMNTSNLTIYIMKTKNHIGFLELSSHHFRVKVVNSHVLFEQQWKKKLETYQNHPNETTMLPYYAYYKFYHVSSWSIVVTYVSVMKNGIRNEENEND